MSVLFTKIVKPHWIRNCPTFYSVMIIELVSNFGLFFVALLNNIETMKSGQVLVGAWMIFCEIHYHIGWEWTEELIFRDKGRDWKIGTLGQFWANIDSYAAQIAIVSILVPF